VPARFADGAHQRFRGIERQQQREPLPRRRRTACGAGPKNRQRDRFQREPRWMAAERGEDELPQQLEEHEREDARHREPRDDRRRLRLALRQLTATNS
jgi:hypothetical protein